MKLWQATTGVLSCILATLFLPLCAQAQDAPQYAPWRDYVLVVEVATDDPEALNYQNEEKPDARYVMMRVRDTSLPIKMDDIQAGYTDFTLQDAKGNEFPAEAFGITTIRIVNNELVLDADQESFFLYFDVPEGIPLERLTLYIDTQADEERIIIPLAKAPQISTETGGRDLASEEAIAGGAVTVSESESIPLGQRLVNALGEEAYATTHAFLEGGNLLKNGSNSSAAKGLQVLLRELGAKITADGKIGPKTIAALGEYGVWFAPLDEEGKLSTVDARVFEDLMLLLLLTKDRAAAATLLQDEAEAEQTLALYDAAEQALQGNFFTAQQLYESLSGFGQGDLRAQLCRQEFPRNGLVYRNEAYSSKRCDLTIKVGGDDGEATYVKVYTLSGDLVLTAFIRAGQKTCVGLPAGTFIIKTGTGTQWFGEAEAFGEGGGARYSRLYLDSGEDTITLESGYSYTLSLAVADSEGGDDISSWPENWADF